jgi:hypothetical protein
MSADQLTALVEQVKTVLAELKATNQKFTKYIKEVIIPFKEAGLHKTYPDLMDAHVSMSGYATTIDGAIKQLEDVIKRPAYYGAGVIKKFLREDREDIDKLNGDIPELTAAINHVLYKPADEEGPAGPEAMKLIAKNPPSNVHYGEAGGRRKTRKHKRKVKRSRRYTKTN